MYRQCLQELHVNGDQAIFLDDLGINLKTAQEFGIKTIKVIKVAFHGKFKGSDKKEPVCFCRLSVAGFI